jgi:hypothetical protein
MKYIKGSPIGHSHKLVLNLSQICCPKSQADVKCLPSEHNL